MAVDMNMKVLIVDDYEAMRTVLRKLLLGLKFSNIDEASDGAEALRKLRRSDFGLVVSDWDMEPMTGIDLLRAVRADDRLKHIPFVMMTAEGRSESRNAAARSGASAYLVKPFDAQTLRSKLVGMLGEF